ASLDFTQINIADDLFTANRGHCLSTCQQITERGVRAAWAAFARVDSIAPSLLKAMKNAGCHTMSFGVESADPQILKTVKKGITLEQVLSAVKMCVDAGITPHASFILGLPGETASTIKKTIEFAERLKNMGASYGFHLLAPFPGTEVRERAEELGIRILTNDWTQYHANRAIVETPGATKEMMDSVVERWEKKFMEWLGYLEKNIQSNTASKDELWQYKKLRYCSIIYELMMSSALEKNGMVHGSRNKVEGIQKLAEQLGGRIPFGSGEILEALDFAADQGTLTCEEKNGVLKWKWKNTLP
ncbi:MAG: B12-binding domain-containing radical SAM protein, partial [Deltaproteobacteria bacterium]